jgi:hypothetical protein
VAILDITAKRLLLTRRQSLTQNPNCYLRDATKDKLGIVQLSN